MPTQTTIQDLRDLYETEEKPYTRTYVLILERPTTRKRERLDTAIAEAGKVTREAAQRFPSVPPQRWASSTRHGSTWRAWRYEFDANLPNKAIEENIMRVRETFRSWQRRGYDGRQPRFETDNRCTFDHENPTYKISENDRYVVSLQLAPGRGNREHLPIRDGEYIRRRIDEIRNGEVNAGRAELLRQNGRYELHQTVRGTAEVIANPATTIGVDVGLTNIAVAGAVGRDGTKRGAELWSGAEMAEMRHRHCCRKQRAQSDAEYDRLRDDESRYVEHVCHRISREVVEWAMQYDRPQIVLEDLTDIRDKFITREREYTPETRRALHSWPFRQLQDNISYKATEVGIPVEECDPRNTSKECNECGHTEEDNREGSHFECLECGYAVNADVNGAFNIALRQWSQTDG